jgi:hypothetical protein
MVRGALLAQPPVDAAARVDSLVWNLPGRIVSTVLSRLLIGNVIVRWHDTDKGFARFEWDFGATGVEEARDIPPAVTAPGAGKSNPIAKYDGAMAAEEIQANACAA